MWRILSVGAAIVTFVVAILVLAWVSGRVGGIVNGVLAFAAASAAYWVVDQLRPLNK